VSSLDIADVRPAQTRFLGEIVLIPASCLPQFLNALSDRHANVCTCHTSAINVFLWLYSAYWLHSGFALSRCNPESKQVAGYINAFDVNKIRIPPGR
jgi:hypothetical protein